MDLKVTHKEDVIQPEGKLHVMLPDMFEIYPVFRYFTKGAGEIDSSVFVKYLKDYGIAQSIEAAQGTYVLTYSSEDAYWHFNDTAASAATIGLIYPSPVDGDTVTVVKYITDAETVDNDEETFQMATFAAVKQRGNDPLALEEGCRWAEVVLGEAPVDIVMQDVQDSVRRVSDWCKVTFSTIKGADGYEYLMYTVSGLNKENP